METKKHYYHAAIHVGVSLDEHTVALNVLRGKKLPIEYFAALIKKIDSDSGGLLSEAAATSEKRVAFEMKYGRYSKNVIIREEGSEYPNDFPVAAVIHITGGGYVCDFNVNKRFMLPIMRAIKGYTKQIDVEWKEATSRHGVDPRDIVAGNIPYDEYITRQLYCVHSGEVATSPHDPPFGYVREEDAIENGIPAGMGMEFEKVNSTHYLIFKPQQTEIGLLYSSFKYEDISDLECVEVFEWHKPIEYPLELKILVVEFLLPASYYNFPENKCAGILVKKHKS